MSGADITGATGPTAVVAAGRPGLRTPRSAAIAGIVFSLLTLASLVTIHFSLPHNPSDSEAWLTTSPRRDLLLVGLSLIPFAAVAFLWFVGVVRDRVGEREDRFFSTVFLGSGLLFVGVLLVGEAVTAGMIMSLPTGDHALAGAAPGWWLATRNVSTELLEAALQMAGAFCTVTSTLLWRTGAAPRWLALSGTVVSVILFFSVYLTQWMGLLFPLWILVLSVYILHAARHAEIEAPL